ncbi:flavodoxin family protein [Lacrimispora amygdalina]|uniref:Flavodoxin family protein n=1 Tax=Lacrimispora amygdalina TaxID=253257 RepID=A0A3E2NIB7_9FIRM|nr:flavodoxin family protein [Clostridium indicum]RFZ80715.1 flavodoxin family protein [Clostridium indicum]
MNIMGIIASQQREGNTAFIVNKLLEGARENGAQTQSFRFSDLDIKPCRGCWACHKNDQGCVIKDDMQKIYNAMEYTDIIILGLPIYMGQMSAQGKIFTDRLFAQRSPRFSPFFKDNAVKRQIVLSFNQGNPNADLFKPYIDYTSQMFKTLEFEVKEIPVVTGLRSGSIYDRKDLCRDLKKIGSGLVVPDKNPAA